MKTMSRHDPGAQHPLHLFLILTFLWLAANIVLRWINWPLFHGHGAYGWPQPPWWKLVLLVAASIAPAGLLTWLLGAALHRLRTPRSLIIAWAVLCLLVLVVELDMSWYAMAKTHITGRDVHMFLTESWSEHFGIRPGDVLRFAALMGVHALALGVAAWGAWRWHRRIALPWRPLVRGGLFLSLALLLVGQVAALVNAADGDKDQWVSVVQANPLAPGLWHVAAESDWMRDAALDELEARLTGDAPLPPPPPPVGLAPGADLLLVTVEGWNFNQFNARTMPFTWAHKDRCRYAERHFATGNATHYGVLGLLFGSPPYFYRGPETEGISGSPFVTALNAAGYRTRRIGADLSIHRNLGLYLENFSEPAIEQPDDDKNLEAALEALRRPGKDFVYLHYLKTHFPYRHAPEFTVFTPEVPDSFDYFTPDLDRYREAVVNRYRNTLRELDAWLEHLFESLPPGTVVAVTGDHSEEMFENGRLGHSSALNEAQTRTPMLLCGPGVTPGVWQATTSHADVFPTLFSALGLPQPPGERLGRDLWQQPAGAAAIAFNNHTRRPQRYRVVGESAWVELRLKDDHLRPWRVDPSVQAVEAEAPLMDLAARLVHLAGNQRR